MEILENVWYMVSFFACKQASTYYYIAVGGWNKPEQLSFFPLPHTVAKYFDWNLFTCNLTFLCRRSSRNGIRCSIDLFKMALDALLICHGSIGDKYFQMYLLWVLIAPSKLLAVGNHWWLLLMWRTWDPNVHLLIINSIADSLCARSVYMCFHKKWQLDVYCVQLINACYLTAITVK